VRGHPVDSTQLLYKVFDPVNGYRRTNRQASKSPGPAYSAALQTLATRLHEAVDNAKCPAWGPAALRVHSPLEIPDDVAADLDPWERQLNQRGVGHADWPGSDLAMPRLAHVVPVGRPDHITVWGKSSSGCGPP
jgi:hypothetical protein